MNKKNIIWHTFGVAKILKELKTKLVRPITFTKNLEEIARNTQIVFDSDDVDKMNILLRFIAGVSLTKTELG